MMVGEKNRKRFEWDDAAVKMLRSEYGSVPVEGLAKKIGCTINAIYMAAHKHGVARQTENTGRNGHPVGHVRWDSRRGLYEKKIASTGNRRADWRRLDLMVWEEKNGPIPEGFILYYPPGSERNLENLSIRRAQVSTEEKELLQLKAEFNRRISELKRLNNTPVALCCAPSTIAESIPRPRYSNADDALLLRLADAYTAREIARYLNRTRKSVEMRLARLRRAGRHIAAPHPCQSYTTADDALIEQLRDTHTHAQIAERLGRSIKSIENRIARLRGKK